MPAHPFDKGLTPPTLHDLERPPKWTRVGPPQPFTTWRAFLSRKLTADFLLPNSAYKMYHLHWAVGRSRGFPYFASSRQRVAPPPTLHDLEGAPKWTRVGPPQPFTTWSASQMDKGLTPPTLHDLERLRKWTRVWPPQPFTTWRGSQMDKGWTPPTLHDLEWLPNGQGLDPPKSDWTPQPFTTWRVLLSRKLTASVTKFCLYNVPFTLRCRPISRFRYFASSREGVALPKCLSES